MGKQGCGHMNDNGERDSDFCMENGLVIGGSIFTHNTIHKLTWVSPHGQVENQIDHVLVNPKWRKSLFDVRDMRGGADVGSDYHLVRMLLKLKNGPQCLVQQKRYNIHLLKDEETSRKFAPEVRNRVQVLGDQQEPDGEPTIEDKWCKKKASYHAASEIILRVKRKHHKDPINLRTFEHINRRRELKGKINPDVNASGKECA